MKTIWSNSSVEQAHQPYGKHRATSIDVVIERNIFGDTFVQRRQRSTDKVYVCSAKYTDTRAKDGVGLKHPTGGERQGLTRMHFRDWQLRCQTDLKTTTHQVLGVDG